jgi:hypothetical protein
MSPKSQLLHELTSSSPNYTFEPYTLYVKNTHFLMEILKKKSLLQSFQAQQHVIFFLGSYAIKDVSSKMVKNSIPSITTE